MSTEARDVHKSCNLSKSLAQISAISEFPKFRQVQRNREMHSHCLLSMGKRITGGFAPCLIRNTLITLRLRRCRIPLSGFQQQSRKRQCCFRLSVTMGNSASLPLSTFSLLFALFQEVPPAPRTKNSDLWGLRGFRG